jgi:hypothetical protein
MILSLIHRFRCNSNCVAEVSRLLPFCANLRSFRADATDPETRPETVIDDMCCAADAHKPSIERGHARVGPPALASDTLPSQRQGPVRAAQVWSCATDILPVFVILHLHTLARAQLSLNIRFIKDT